MRKQTVTLIATLIAIGMLYTACDDKKHKPTGDLEFQNIRVTEAVHLFGDTTKPGSRLIIDYIYVEKADNDSLKDILNKHFITTCLDENYRGLDPHEAIKRYVEIYTTDYRTNLEPLFLEDQKLNEREDDPETVASWYDYYQNIESHIQLYQGDLLVYRAEFNEFTGGAHGMERTSFLNFDLKNRKLITLNDLFPEEAMDALTHLLWLQLMRDNKVTKREELENMGYGLTGDLVPTENFHLGHHGITFLYNVYEFAPYSMGAVEIKLPFEAIMHLTKDVDIINNLQRYS